jgi:hypothetical protein
MISSKTTTSSSSLISETRAIPEKIQDWRKNNPGKITQYVIALTGLAGVGLGIASLGLTQKYVRDTNQITQESTSKQLSQANRAHKEAMFMDEARAEFQDINKILTEGNSSIRTQLYALKRFPAIMGKCHKKNISVSSKDSKTALPEFLGGRQQALLRYG